MKTFFRQPSIASLFSIGIRGYYAVVSFAITAVLAAVLPPAEFGRYSFLFSITVLVAGFAQAGLMQLLVRETAQSRDPSRIRTFTEFSLFVVLATTTIGFGVYLGWQWAVVGDWLSSTLIYFLIVTLCTTSILSAVVRGLGKPLLGQLPDLVIRPTVFLVAVGGTVLLGTDQHANFVLSLHLSATLCSGIFVWVTYRSVMSLVPVLAVKREEFSRSQWLKDMLGIASVAWVAGANSQFIIIIVGLLAGDMTVGLLRVATQFATLIALGLHAVEAVQLPQFAKLFYERNTSDLQGLVRLNTRLSLLIALPISLVIFVAARPVLMFFFSPVYADASSALIILALGQLLSACVGSAAVLLVSCSLEQFALLGSLVGLVSNMVLAFTLIPAYGLSGAAVAISVSLVLRNFFCAGIAYYKLNILSFPIGSVRRKI